MNCVDFTQLYVKGLLIYHVKLVVFLIPAHIVVIPLAKYILPYVEHLILSNSFFFRNFPYIAYNVRLAALSIVL